MSARGEEGGERANKCGEPSSDNAAFCRLPLPMLGGAAPPRPVPRNFISCLRSVSFERRKHPVKREVCKAVDCQIVYSCDDGAVALSVVPAASEETHSAASHCVSRK